MITYEKWLTEQGAHEGSCINCNVEGMVVTYPKNPFAPRTNPEHTMDLCFICACVAGANAQEYPEQHPYHSQVVQPILGAISLLLQTIKKPKKAAKPKGPKGIQLTPGVQSARMRLRGQPRDFKDPKLR